MLPLCVWFKSNARTPVRTNPVLAPARQCTTVEGIISNPFHNTRQVLSPPLENDASNACHPKYNNELAFVQSTAQLSGPHASV